VCARRRALETIFTVDEHLAFLSFTAAQTRGHWVAGSSPAMTDFFVCFTRE